MKTYVIHVKSALERERHIKKQLSNVGLTAQFILEGDKSDLTKKVLDEHFSGNRKNVSNSTSCVYKHILAYKEIVENKIEIALILEDDIFFYKNFQPLFNKIIQEAKKENYQSFIISLEDSLLEYVKRSERIKNKYTYPKKYGRMAGAYLIDYKAAKSILDEILDNKCHLPMDFFHNSHAKKGKLNIYWSQPTIAIQGSLKGNIPTLLDDKSSGFSRVISFFLQKWYKRMIYNFR